LILGGLSAWLVSTCDFPGRKWLSWALIMPLAIPSYIAAYTWAGILGFTGPVQRTLRDWLGSNAPHIDIMHLPGVAMILALVLYPYVYLVGRAAFQRQSRSLWEAARLLGQSPWQAFWRVALPLARPALVAGLALVLMEILNDYGAVQYFGVRTFTTGIFRAWFSLGDTDAAIRLSGFLLAAVGLLLFLERRQRGRSQTRESEAKYTPWQRIRLNGWQAAGASLVCLIPVLFGFAIPVLQLLAWAAKEAGKGMDMPLATWTWHGFLMAASASILCAGTALILIFAKRLGSLQGWASQWLSRLAVIGYAVPGAVIAIGVFLPMTRLNEAVINTYANWGLDSPGLFLHELYITLLLGYLIRFLAVAYHPLESGFDKINPRLEASARLLGARPWRLFWKIDLPLLKSSLMAAMLMVFIDVLKELPLTLILRPFNYNSLATRAFDLASEEQLAESALPALIIILTALVPTLLLNRVSQSSASSQGT
ncbi:MAG: iron ABC transporter permease, partial [Bacteroidota bacterium]